MDYSKHIQKAEEAARRRNYDFAVQLYQQLLEIDPDVGEARAGLRRVLRKRHEQKRGGGLFSKLKGAGPLGVAKGLAKAGRHDAAAKSYESYLATNPMDEEANLLLGIALESAGHERSALAVYEFVAEIAPKNPEGLKRAGAMMAKQGDPLRALEYYERALEADPRDRDALKARKDLAAEAALQKGRYDQVAHSREQIKDKDEAVRLERAQRRQLSPEELEQERVRLEERFAEDASDVDVMLELARVLEKLKDPAAALDLVERALTFRQGDRSLEQDRERLKVAALKRALARADKLGDNAEADRLEAELQALELEGLREAVRRSPGDAAAHVALGRALLRQGDPDQAAGELQKATQDPRQRPEALFLLGQCFEQKGFLDLAKKQYREALEGVPAADERAREILYNLGSIAEAEGDPAEARSCYARIFETDITYRDVAAKMERLKP